MARQERRRWYREPAVIVPLIVLGTIGGLELYIHWPRPSLSGNCVHSSSVEVYDHSPTFGTYGFLQVSNLDPRVEAPYIAFTAKHARPALLCTVHNGGTATARNVEVPFRANEPPMPGGSRPSFFVIYNLGDITEGGDAYFATIDAYLVKPQGPGFAFSPYLSGPGTNINWLNAEYWIAFPVPPPKPGT